MITSSLVFRAGNNFTYLTVIMEYEAAEKKRHEALGVKPELEDEKPLGYYRKKNGVYEVFGYYENIQEAELAMNGVDTPMTILNRETEARAFLLGYALTADVVLVGNDSPGCEKTVSAFAQGLQEGCFQIGPGGPVFTPLSFGNLGRRRAGGCR